MEHLVQDGRFLNRRLGNWASFGVVLLECLGDLVWRAVFHIVEQIDQTNAIQKSLDSSLTANNEMLRVKIEIGES